MFNIFDRPSLLDFDSEIKSAKSTMEAREAITDLLLDMYFVPMSRKNVKSKWKS